MGYHDTLVSDFRDSRFQQAFKQYFSELQLQVKDWDGLFAEMDGEGGNQAFVRAAAGGPVIGFIQFKPIAFTSWFFEGACGFIREFWVAEEYRGMGHGSALLGLCVFPVYHISVHVNIVELIVLSDTLCLIIESVYRFIVVDTDVFNGF